MWSPFKRKKDNAWLDIDRRERRNTVLIAVLFVSAVLAGIALLIYAVMHR